MLISSLFVSLLLQASTTLAAITCSTDSLQTILSSNSTANFAAQITKSGPFSQNGINFTIPSSIPKSSFPICIFNILVQSSPNSTFNSGILLPQNWNGKLHATGNPAFSGSIQWSFMGQILRYGPAVATSTDSGHIGGPDDVSWAVNNPESVIDWAWRSHHWTTVLAKTIANSFYGSPVKFSYWSACSNGGRQGMKQMELFPDSYDGMIVGAPPWWLTHMHSFFVQMGIWNLPVKSTGHVKYSQIVGFANAVLSQCDAQDGVQDGIVSQPYACKFNSSALLCSSTNTNSSTCLTPAQLTTMSEFYNDWRGSTGDLIFPGFPLSTTVLRYGDVTSAPDNFGLEYLEGFVYNNTAWNWSTFAGEATVKYADSIDAGDAVVSTDLSAYQARGGKLLMYHGLQDDTVPTSSSIYYYQLLKESFAKTNPGVSLDSWFKFYLIPGMNHCFGAPIAPTYIAAPEQSIYTPTGPGFSSPGYTDAQHDVYLAMMAWVENGTAPNALIASKWNGDNTKNGISMQRPLCPYPQQQKYTGGDFKSPSSWTCVDSTALQFPLAQGSAGTVNTTGIAGNSSNVPSSGTTVENSGMLCLGLGCATDLQL